MGRCMKIEIQHDSYTEIFNEGCFSDKEIAFSFLIAEDEWIKDEYTGKITRIVKKAELKEASVCTL